MQWTFDTPDAVTLSLEIVAGEVTVETAERTTTDVEVEVREGDETAIADVTVEAHARGRRQEIRVMQHRRRWRFGRSPELRVRIAAPQGAAVKSSTVSADVRVSGPVDTVDARTTSGDLEVERAAGRVVTRSTSGSIRVAEAGDAIEAQTVSGDVHVGHAGGAVRARGVSGDLEIELAEHGADIRTTSGDARLRAVRAGAVDVRSVSGDVSVGVCRGSRLRIDAQSVSGTVASDLDIVEQPVGDGPLIDLQVRTVSGGLRLERADAVETPPAA